MQVRRLLGALEETQFRRLYLARAFSQLGDGLLPVPLAFAVLEVDPSPSASRRRVVVGGDLNRVRGG